MSKGSGSTRAKNPSKMGGGSNWSNSWGVTLGPLTEKQTSDFLNSKVSKEKIEAKLDRENSPSFSYFGGRVKVNVYQDELKNGSSNAVIEVTSGYHTKNVTEIENTTYDNNRKLANEVKFAVIQHLRDFPNTLQSVEDYWWDLE